MKKPEEESWGDAPPQNSLSRRAAAAFYYCVSSIAVQFMNKALFTLYKFQFPLTVALMQMVVISPVCYAVARPRLDLVTAKSVVPLAVVHVINVVAGLVGTAGLNVPMFIALRRFTLFCTIVLERLMMKKQHDKTTLGAVSLMIGGALVAAITDLSFNLVGYTAVFFNDFTTSLLLVMVSRIPVSKDLSTTGLLFYTAALSLPLLGILVAISGEVQGIVAYPLLPDRSFLVVLLSSCFLGLTINHSTFLCTKMNDPLATSVAGSLKNVIMTIIGSFAFGDFIYSSWNSLGLALSMVGALWYATKSAFKQIDRKKKPIINQLFRHEDGPRIGRGDRPTVAPERGPGQLRGVSDPLLQHQRPETPSNV